MCSKVKRNDLLTQSSRIGPFLDHHIIPLLKVWLSYISVDRLFRNPLDYIRQIYVLIIAKCATKWFRDLNAIGSYILYQVRGQISCIYDHVLGYTNFECVSIVFMLLPNIICRVPK